jgi:hypothetical protein
MPFLNSKMFEKTTMPLPFFLLPSWRLAMGMVAGGELPSGPALASACYCAHTLPRPA